MIARRCNVTRRFLPSRKVKNFLLANALPFSAINSNIGSNGRIKFKVPGPKWQIERNDDLSHQYGAELMLGRVLNSHQQYICRQLADNVTWSTARLPWTIPLRHNRDVAEAIDRADLIITTGGLGPTSDDRTRDLIAELLGRPLYQDESVLDHIHQFFRARKRKAPNPSMSRRWSRKGRSSFPMRMAQRRAWLLPVHHSNRARSRPCS